MFIFFDTNTRAQKSSVIINEKVFIRGLLSLTEVITVDWNVEYTLQIVRKKLDIKKISETWYGNCLYIENANSPKTKDMKDLSSGKCLCIHP